MDSQLETAKRYGSKACVLASFPALREKYELHPRGPLATLLPRYFGTRRPIFQCPTCPTLAPR